MGAHPFGPMVAVAGYRPPVRPNGITELDANRQPWLVTSSDIVSSTQRTLIFNQTIMSYRHKQQLHNWPANILICGYEECSEPHSDEPRAAPM